MTRDVFIDGIEQPVEVEELSSPSAKWFSGVKVDGKYPVDEEAEYTNEEEPKLISKAKEDKLNALGSIFVEVNGVKYDAHKEAIENMNAVINTANRKMFQAISAGTAAAVAYDEVFKSVINWKNYDNEISEVQVESIAEALEMAITKRAEVYGV